MNNVVHVLTDYLKASYAEMQKVKWPSRDETLRQTGIVIVLTIVVSLFLGVADVVFQQVLTRIL